MSSVLRHLLWGGGGGVYNFSENSIPSKKDEWYLKSVDNPELEISLWL